GREPCRQVAELGEKHLREINARLAQLRAYRRALAKSVSAWRKDNLSERHCAGEFCDLIQRLPIGQKLSKKILLPSSCLEGLRSRHAGKTIWNHVGHVYIRN